MYSQPEQQSSTMIKQPQSNVILQNEIGVAQLTLQRLKVERQLKAIRAQRKKANDEHGRLVHNCKQTSSELSKRLNKVIYDNTSVTLRNYIDVLQPSYESSVSPLIVRVHAQLIKCLRAQELLESYTNSTRQDYDSLIGNLRETGQELLLELQDVRDQHHAQSYLIQEQLVILVSSRVKRYYEKKNKNNQTTDMGQSPGSFFQQLIRRKARQRFACSVAA